MSWYTAKKALDCFFIESHQEKRRPPYIYFSGGEPLLNWDLLKNCIEYCERQAAEGTFHFRLAVNTNGLKLDVPKAKYLASNNVDVILSIDGQKESHDKCRLYRNGKPSFAECRKALDTIIKYFENPATCTVVSPENVKYLPESVDFLLDEGIRRIMINPNFFGKWNDETIKMWEAGYKHIAKRFENAFRHGQALMINLLSSKISARLLNENDPLDCCGQLKRRISVAPSGRVYACQLVLGNDDMDLGYMGHVNDGFHSLKLPDICCSFNQSECERCDLKQRCRGWCSCGYYAPSGLFSRPDGLICWHEQLVINLADSLASKLYKEKNTTFMAAFGYESDEFSPITITSMD
jgi:uncharacterized protein